MHSYCSQFGEINGAHHYNIRNEDLHYILIEYSNQQNVGNALQSSQFNEDGSGVPVHSPFLWFRAGKTKTKNIKSNVPLTNKNCNDIISDIDLLNLIQSAESVSDQIKILFRTTCLNDLGIRLRFLAAQQIERSVMGMFPGAQALLFGSSVNGFGKMGCDLDLILRFEGETGRSKNGNSRLVFHSKENASNGRSQTQRQMECIGDLMHLFLPGVGHVRRILQARIPIIKYHHEHLDLEIDLSMSNMTGVYMSEIFYMFGQLDDRVRPLTFCIRKWANATGLTNPSPGRWITNFSLTALVLFFLQQLKDPILPPIIYLIKNATINDVRITEDNINCTYVRDLNSLKFKTNNIDSLETLVLKFFEFYSQFDFHNNAISLNDGKTVLKPDHCAMYIVNPLENILNVSKNISFEELERFRIEVRNAAWIVESNHMQSVPKDTNWGILNLFKLKSQFSVKPTMLLKPRMVDVIELFNENPNDIYSSPPSSTQQDKLLNGQVEYKNTNIRKQVDSIKLKTRHELKQMKEIPIKRKQ